MTQAAKACPHNPEISCGNCRLSAICLPLALEDNDIVKLDEIVQRGRPLQKGDHIYREQDEFTSVFAVRSGTIKAYRLTDHFRFLLAPEVSFGLLVCLRGSASENLRSWLW